MEASRSPAPLQRVANQRAGVLSRSGRGKGESLKTDPKEEMLLISASLMIIIPLNRVSHKKHIQSFKRSEKI